MDDEIITQDCPSCGGGDDFEEFDDLSNYGDV
jgi:hypothetical protein